METSKTKRKKTKYLKKKKKKVAVGAYLSRKKNLGYIILTMKCYPRNAS